MGLSRTCNSWLLLGAIALQPFSLVGQQNDAQAAGSTVTQAPEWKDSGSGKAKVLPVDLSAVVASRYEPERGSGTYGPEANATLFISKRLGAWQMHAKLNANSARQLDRDGIGLIRQREHFATDVDAAWVNYNARDWLQWRTGLLYIPTYWGSRRFQSATLTVADPFIDQEIFPAAFTGTMLHGDRLFEDGGFSYSVYAGKGLEADHLDGEECRVAKPRIYGGKGVWHVPTRRRLDLFDISYQRMRGAYPGRASEVVDGIELRVEKGRISLLGELAQARVRLAGDGDRVKRFGYYWQPSLKVSQRLTGVMRYENARLRHDQGIHMSRLSMGAAYRARPSVWIRADVLRHGLTGEAGHRSWGGSVGIAYFFQIQ
jgi:hypothetical protein